MAPGKRLADTASELNSAAVHLLRALRATDRAAGLTPARLSALSVLVFGGPCPLGGRRADHDICDDRGAGGKADREKRKAGSQDV